MAAAVAATVAEEAQPGSGRGRKAGTPGGTHGGAGNAAVAMAPFGSPAPVLAPPPAGPGAGGSAAAAAAGVVARVVSKFRGVTWDDDTSKWRAMVFDNGSQSDLGLFDTQVTCAANVAPAQAGVCLCAGFAWGAGRPKGFVTPAAPCALRSSRARP
eukprot:225915-Chlamydomonas_euryale.AAC.1